MNLPIGRPTRYRPLLIAGGGLLFFGAMAFWGGLPNAAQMPIFLTGLVVLVIIALWIVGLAWALLFRPTAKSAVSRVSPLTSSQRQIMAAALIITMFINIAGVFWDEAWHTKFGLPFGEDFFWRPHIMIYLGLFNILLTGSIGWYAMIFQAKGSWLQRFRSDPALGLLLISSLFLFYSLPTDPIWHSIYGTDLTAFSVPHLLLGVMETLAVINGASLTYTAFPTRSWGSILKLKAFDVLPLLAFITMQMVLLILLTADWFSVGKAGVTQIPNILLQRPVWLLPFLIFLIGSWVGTLVVEATRCYGTATLVGVAAYGLRVVLLEVFQHPNPNSNSWLLIIPVMAAVDIVYAWRIRSDRPVSWWMAGLACAGTMVIVLPVFNQFFAYPQVNPETLLTIVPALLVATLVGSWLGQGVGKYIGNDNKVLEARPVAVIRKPVFSLAMVATLAFIIWFVGTATPPLLK